MEEVSKGKNVEGLILTHSKDESLKYAVISHPKISLRYYRLILEFVSKEIA